MKPKTSLAPLSPEQSQRRKAVGEFFRSAPAALKPMKDKRITRSTRAPQYFDMHLHPDLLLHHVVKVPSITSDLLGIAGDALDSSTTLPPITADFPQKDVRNKAYQRATTTEIKMESEIQAVYKNITSQYCQMVAATLEFQLPQWSMDGLLWTTSNVLQQGNGASEGSSNDEGSSSFANADGILQISAPNNDGKRNLPPEVGATFPVIAVWEFKNMKAGDEITMEGIRNLSNSTTWERFPWEGCPKKEECLAEHGTTRCKMGFDAEEPVCSSIMSARELVRSQHASHPHPKLPDLEDYTKCPRHVLQQVWAEAVKFDATFVILHSGNLEMIGVRDRENQALYISNIIKVPNCQYFKLHTGLSIAAIRDAATRTSLIREKRPLPVSWTFNDPLAEELLVQQVGKSIQSRVFLTASWINEDGHVIFIPKSGYRRAGLESEPPRPSEDNILRIRLEEVRGGNPVVKGYLQIPGVSCDDMPVLVKIASDEASAEKLRQEYTIQDELGKVQGVVKTIGLFERRWRNQDGREVLQAGLLVMEDAGETVAELRKKNDGSDFLSRGQLTEFHEILEDIHAAGYARLNLTLEGLWVQKEYNSAVVAIMGFADAIKSVDPLTHTSEARQDHKRLMELVPNLLRRKLEEDEERLARRFKAHSQPLPDRPKMSSAETWDFWPL